MLTFPNIDEIEKKCKELMIKTIAKNLRNIRLSRRFSQEEVSVRAGISAKHMQNLEAGKITLRENSTSISKSAWRWYLPNIAYRPLPAYKR